MKAPARNSLAVIGAGPIGLETAATALELGFDVHVFERGEVGAHLLAWGHVRMFTPWRENIGPASERLLARHGWAAPDRATCPTGAEMVEALLAPLARTPELRDRVHAHSQVVHVGRHGALRGEWAGDPERRRHPFRLLVRDGGGRENMLHAFAVVDASGVYGSPNRAGTGGIPARGESYLAPQMCYRCDDVAGLRRGRHAGRRTLVIGGGATAATTVGALAALASETQGTSVAWATRDASGALAGETQNDPLPARAALFAAAHALQRGENPAVTWIGGVEVEGFEYNSATHRYRVTLAIGETNRVEEADEVVVNTGFGPDDSLCRELHVADASGHPEPDFHVLGARAAARGTTFLLSQGYAQAADVIARLARDLPEPAVS
jgi:cation diffusion facilitator CzcD-associated flavoprotein CzcO